MYCKHCGKELKEGAAFCNECGSRTNTAAVSDEDKKLSITEAIGSLLFIGLIVILVINCKQFNDKKKATQKSNTSYQKLMENYCHSIEELDDKELINCVIPATITKEHKKDDYYKEITSSIKDYLNYAQAYLNLSDSSDFTVKLDDIYNVSPLSKNEMEDIQDYYDNLYSNFGYKKVPEVEQVLDIECSFKWRQSKDKGMMQESFIVAYLDGEGWFIADFKG